MRVGDVVRGLPVADQSCDGVYASHVLEHLSRTDFEAAMRETFRILDKYPQIFKQATFIVGTKYETRESLFRQADLAKELNVDYPAFHPITPVLGTPVPGSRPCREAP